MSEKTENVKENGNILINAARLLKRAFTISDDDARMTAEIIEIARQSNSPAMLYADIKAYLSELDNY